MNRMHFKSKQEDDVQKSLGTAKTYWVKVFYLRKDVYLVRIFSKEVVASSSDEAIAITTRALEEVNIGPLNAKLVYEVEE